MPAPKYLEPGTIVIAYHTDHESKKHVLLIDEKNELDWLPHHEDFYHATGIRRTRGDRYRIIKTITDEGNNGLFTARDTFDYMTIAELLEQGFIEKFRTTTAPKQKVIIHGITRVVRMTRPSYKKETIIYYFNGDKQVHHGTLSDEEIINHGRLHEKALLKNQKP